VSLIETSGIVDPWTTSVPRPVIDPTAFRTTLSHFPSGVVVITGFDERGAPAGLTCQSFTSLSLDPPLVLIAPAKSSKSWPMIAGGHRFAVNILGADHREISGVFARSGTDKFSQVAWRVSPEGLPVLDDAIAVIECEIDAIHHGGDHWIVVGAVRAIGVSDDTTAPEPLVFYRSSYRTLDPASAARADGTTR
jgi:3-hydroxy-9,10-secoandrosta-1,3,5(10)-triene-9,17-dione monooxygenase reductase component